jgi:hypothetical protein
MTRFFLILTTILLINSCIVAQHYKTAGGLRLGNEIGLTFQQVIGEKVTLEAIYSTRQSVSTHNFALLGERHFNLVSRRINFYGGAGGHFGLLKEAKPGYQHTAGVSAIGGMELTIKRLNFSFDYKPAINLVKGDNQSRFAGQFAVSARYIFVERENLRERIKDKFRRKT